MRNPVRKRNVALLLSIFSLLGIAVAWPEHTILPDVLRTVLGVAGLSVLPFAGVSALMLHADVRRKRRIDRGEGVVARWRIDAQRWKDFVAVDKHYSEQDSRFRNGFSVRATPAESEPEVIVIADAIQLDGDLQSVPRGGYPSILQIDWLDANPPCLNFQMAHGGSEGETLYFSLRFPIAPGAESDARRVMLHFSQVQSESIGKPGIAVRHPRRTQVVCLIILVLSAAAFFGGMSLRERQDIQTAVLVVTICGALFGLGALLMIGIVQLLIWNDRRS